MATKGIIRVIAVHKLPVNQETFEKVEDFASFADAESAAEFRSQYWENWSNAWLVVVGFDGAADELDFDAIGFGDPHKRDSMQAPWLETFLCREPGKVRAAFYLHYLDTAKPLWYGAQSVALPDPTPPSNHLLDQVPYCSPD